MTLQHSANIETVLNSSTFLESQFSMHHLSVCPLMCILFTRMDSSAAGVRYFPIRDPPDNSPNRVYPGIVLGIPSGILRTTAPSVSVLGLSWGSHQGSSGQQPQACLSWDPPDNSPKRVYPGTVLGSSGQQPQAFLSWDCPGDPIRDPPDNSPKRVCPDCPGDPIRDPPDNSPKRVYPGTVLGIPSGILRTTAPTVSVLGLSSGSHQGSSGQQPQACLSWDCPGDPIMDPPDNSPKRVCPDCPGDPIRDPPDNSPKRVYPGTVQWIPPGILWTTAPSVSVLGLSWGSHASGILGTPVHMLLMS